MTEKLWVNDYKILFNNDNYYKIIPSNTMTLNEKLNSITRFSIIFSIIMFILSKNYLYLYIFVIVFIIIYLLNLFNKETFNLENNNHNNEHNGKSDNVTNVECQSPNKENPLMNVLLTDNFKEKKEACDVEDENVMEEITHNLNKNNPNLFDVNSIYNKMSEYNFYSMPNTKVPNDQTAFANWLYNSPNECKKNYENKKSCLNQPKPYTNLKNKLSNF